MAAASALQELGHPSGAYLSPHVLSYTERVMLGGKFVSEEEFALAMAEVMRVADKSEIPASQFELLTAGALVMFRKAGVEWAVLEAGLGARHDATTAAGSETVILTNVGLDHTEYLGDTVEEIAHEKLASLQPGNTLILGTQDEKIGKIAERECDQTGARLVKPKDFSQGHTSEQTDLPDYIIRNTGLGIQAAEVVTGHRIGEETRRRVIEGVSRKLPARFEVHSIEGVPVIFDGGHNLEGLSSALRAVRERYSSRPLGVVFGVLRDKDIGSMLTALEKEAQHISLTRPDNERAAEPEALTTDYDPLDANGNPAAVIEDVREALDTSVREMKKLNGVVLVTGSLYTGAPLLGEIRAG